MSNQPGNENGTAFQGFLCKTHDINTIPWERKFCSGLQHVNFHHSVSGELSDHCFASKSVVSSSTFQTSVSLPSVDRSQHGPCYTASLHRFPFSFSFTLLQIVLVRMLVDTTSTAFGGISMFTVTAISVDRLLALMLELRYGRIVTLKRVHVIVSVFWLASSAAAMMFFYDRPVAIGITSMALILTLLCLDLLLHENLCHITTSPI